MPAENIEAAKKELETFKQLIADRNVEEIERKLNEIQAMVSQFAQANAQQAEAQAQFQQGEAAQQAAQQEEGVVDVETKEDDTEKFN
jgi:hypothetical protein